GKNQHYLEPVRVVTFDTDKEIADVQRAVDETAKALSTCEPHDGNDGGIKTIAVIARGNEHVARLQTYFAGASAKPTQRVLWNNTLTKDFVRVVYWLLRGDVYSAVAAYETLLCSAGEYDRRSEMRADLVRTWCGPTGSLFDYRVAVFADLKTIA